MTDINSVAIRGRLVADGELKEVGDSFVVEMRIAFSTDNKVGNEWEEHANFITCNWWGNRARGLAPWIKKGTEVFVVGTLRQDRWEDKETQQKRSTFKIVVRDINLGRKPKDLEGLDNSGPAPF